MIIENICCQGSVLDYEFYFRSKVHRTVSSIRNQFCRRNLRFYGNLNHILFMGCKVKSAGFSNWCWDLAGSFTETGNCIIKTAGRNPVFITPRSICQSALSTLGYQFHPFIQGAPWSTFVTHNETLKYSKFLSPIPEVEQKSIYYHHYELEIGKCPSTQELSAYTKRDLVEIIKKLCEMKQVSLIDGCVCKDHIHVYVAIQLQMSVSGFMSYLKGKSTLMLFDRHPEYRTKWGDRHFWARGYYVTVGNVNEERKLKYIQEQEENDKLVHHKLSF